MCQWFPLSVQIYALFKVHHPYKHLVTKSSFVTWGLCATMPVEEDYGGPWLKDQQSRGQQMMEFKALSNRNQKCNWARNLWTKRGEQRLNNRTTRQGDNQTREKQDYGEDRWWKHVTRSKTNKGAYILWQTNKEVTAELRTTRDNDKKQESKHWGLKLKHNKRDNLKLNTNQEQRVNRGMIKMIKPLKMTKNPRTHGPALVQCWFCLFWTENLLLKHYNQLWKREPELWVTNMDEVKTPLELYLLFFYLFDIFLSRFAWSI